MSSNSQAPLELLHAAVALYSTCLPGPSQSPQALYRTLCAEGARTVLLLRDASGTFPFAPCLSSGLTSPRPRMRPDVPVTLLPVLFSGTSTEIIHEWENSGRGHQQTRTSPDSSDEPDTEPKPVHGQDSNRNRNPNRKPFRSEIFSTFSCGQPSLDDECLKRQGVPDQSGDSRDGNSGQYHGSIHWTRPYSAEHLKRSSGSSPIPINATVVLAREEEDADEAFFSRGLGHFLRAVGERRRERSRALAAWSLAPRHAGPEHRLLACATFAKNYRIPGTKAVFLSLLAVRRRFRKHGIGTFLLKQLRSPAVVGPYDALVVKSSPGTVSFFLKNGFTDDVVLNSRFRELDETNQAGNLLCYLPPFDGHYPTLPGTPEWNRPEALAAMEEEVERWKQKSLESYQCQVTCLTRLQHEIFRLHALLKKQEHTVQNLRKENCRLQSKLSRGM
ncbi:unnamed protein product [Ixodes hexagonus]